MAPGRPVPGEGHGSRHQPQGLSVASHNTGLAVKAQYSALSCKMQDVAGDEQLMLKAEPRPYAVEVRGKHTSEPATSCHFLGLPGVL